MLIVGGKDGMQDALWVERNPVGRIKNQTHHNLKGAFEKEPVEEIAKAGVEHNQHQRDLIQLMIEEMIADIYIFDKYGNFWIIEIYNTRWRWQQLDLDTSF